MDLLSAVVLGTVDMLARPQTLAFILGIARKELIGRPRRSFLLGRAAMKYRFWHVRNEELPVGFSVTKPTMGRLVVQLHHARRAGKHIDLRISGIVKGETISFAVPKARLPGPKSRLLAVLQPNHTEEYSDFEGDIPSGYGEGRVEKLLDVKAEVIKADDEEIQFVAFMEDGPREYTLVRTDGANWIFQQTGLSKVQRVPKPVFSGKGSLDKPWTYEYKVDGSMAAAVVRGGKARLFSHRISSRTGELIEYKGKTPQLSYGGDPELKETVLLGELYHQKKSAAQLGGLLNMRNPLLARALGSTKVKMAIWDVKRLDGEDVSKLPYYARRRMMEDLVSSGRLPPGYHVVPAIRDGESPERFYERALAQKRIPVDGIVCKDPDEPYKEERKQWYKIKPEWDDDLEIVDVTRGEGRHSDKMGALIVDAGGKKVHVGSGFTDDERRWFFEHRDEAIGEKVKVAFHDRPGQKLTGPRYMGPSSDSELDMKMYADQVGISPYQLKSAAGWRAISSAG